MFILKKSLIKIYLIILSFLFVFSSDAISPDSIRVNLLDSITKQLNVRETSYNRGYMIDIYNREVGAPLGSPYCGAFVGSNLTWQGVKNPHSAWSPNYAASQDIIWRPKRKTNLTPKTGDVVTFYYANLGRVGHTGFYIETDKDGYFITIEGNTNGSGDREGDGVHKKKRNPNKVHAVTRYIK